MRQAPIGPRAVYVVRMWYHNYAGIPSLRTQSAPNSNLIISSTDPKSFPLSDNATMANLSNSVHVVNGYDKDAYTYYPILIVGAGESGIALGCRLKEKLGFDQFRIFDRQSGVGGTWWTNRYPGVACDMYVFRFSVEMWLKTAQSGCSL